MCFTKIYGWLQGLSIKNNKIDIQISNSEVKSILTEEFGSTCKIYLSDGYYLRDTKQSLIDFLAKDNTDKFIYKKEVADCDDFSFRLLGNASFGDLEGTAFGILWTKTSKCNHAVNCYIDNELNVWIVEPQNDSIFPLPKDWHPMLVVM